MNEREMSAPRFSRICHTKKRATLAEIFRAVKLAKKQRREVENH